MPTPAFAIPPGPIRSSATATSRADELFEVARLVIAAEIAKIHTIEWTTQLLYDEPLYRGMNANWSGLFNPDSGVATALRQIVARNFGTSDNVKKATQWYCVFAAGPGIFGLGSKVYAGDPIFAAFDRNKKDIWDLKNPDHVNGGINHFGSPFNFPEEFVTVYRLHALVPDLIEYRELEKDPNRIQNKIPVVETFRGKATDAMRPRGMANWALSMGRQRLGLLALQNHPRFLQNLKMTRLQSPTQQIDVAALDLIRDRERGVPRFNEFRRQYGLRQLTSFDDFIDQHLAPGSAGRKEQETLVDTLREVYGRHKCDASLVITDRADESRRITRSTIASANRTAAWWTTSRTSTRWWAGWPKPPGPTGMRSRRPSSSSSSSTPRGASSATASSPRASARSSTATWEWIG